MAKLVKMASLLILLCFLMAGTILVNVKAEVPGVTQGNVFEYNMVAHWNSPLETVPAELQEVNQTKTITITVDDVSGELISTKIATSYLNGTQTVANGTCNIDTGELIGVPFIGANLNKNDLVNPSATEPWSVNETVTRTYQDSTRETNHLKIEDSQTYQDVGQVKTTYDYYFDRSTGVLVDYTMEISYGNLTSSTESTLLASNVWSVDAAVQIPDSTASSPPTLYIAVAVAAVIIAIIAAALIVKKRRRTEVE